MEKSAMGSAPSRFRQTDVTRAIRAAKAAGIRPHVWIEGGVIHIAEADAAQVETLTPEEDGEPVAASDERACDETFG